MFLKTLGRRCFRTKDIQIFDNYFFRTLKFDSDAPQTVLNKFNPQKAELYYIFALIFMARLFPGDCCLLGLGGAAAAHALSPYLNNFKITAVEVNATIIELAAKYFMSDKIPQLEVIQDDASCFVEKHQQPFKHILVDLFNAHSFPESCYNELFFANCKRLLLADGILTVNLANRKEQRPIFEILKRQFSGSLFSIPVKKCSNLVIIAINAKSVVPILKSLKNSKLLSRLTWDEVWGYLGALR